MGMQSLLSLTLVCGVHAAKKVGNTPLSPCEHASCTHADSKPLLFQRWTQVEEAPQGNALVDYAMGLVNDIIAASVAGAKDCGGLLMAAPRFGVDAFVYLVDVARGMPAKITNVYNGDSAELDKMTDFCVYAASTIFCVYASVTALNLVLSLATKVIDYAASCGLMTIPTKVLGQALPDPVLKVRNLLQREILDRIRNFKVNAWIIPLEGQSGAPTLKGATSAMATAISACMILSCAPAVHALMKGGADKAGAEALAYTLGTALGLQYLVKINA